MTSLKLTIPSTFNVPRPILRDDDILSSGSLMLVDATHPAGQFAAGIPSTGTMFPNIAAPDTLLGAGDHRPKMQVNGNWTTGTTEKLERSSKGGIHGIVSATAPNALNFAIMIFPDTFMSYMQAHTPTNNFYLSIWGRQTRATPNTTGARAFSALSRYNNGTFGQFLLSQTPTQQLPSQSQGNRLGFRADNAAAVGPLYQSIAGKSNEQITLANYSAAGTKAFGTWGRINPWNGSATDLQSWIFYRAYVEDLTVSGRTYDEVDALDYQLYSRHVLNAGGRYYGDTFTAPSTIA